MKKLTYWESEELKGRFLWRFTHTSCHPIYSWAHQFFTRIASIYRARGLSLLIPWDCIQCWHLWLSIPVFSGGGCGSWGLFLYPCNYLCWPWWASIRCWGKHEAPCGNDIAVSPLTAKKMIQQNLNVLEANFVQSLFRTLKKTHQSGCMFLLNWGWLLEFSDLIKVHFWLALLKVWYRSWLLFALLWWPVSYQ